MRAGRGSATASPANRAPAHRGLDRGGTSRGGSHKDGRSATRPVRAALVSPGAGLVDPAAKDRTVNATALMATLQLAKDSGADIVLLAEECFGLGLINSPHGAGPGEGLGGPHLAAVKVAARALRLYVVVPYRVQAAAGVSYNAAVVVGRDGVLANSTAGQPWYQKSFPRLGYPMGTLSANSAGGYAPYGAVDHGGETPLIPGQHGVQAWDLAGIGRVAVLIGFDVNFFELWHQAYALGAKIVFWPSTMATPDRDAISAARLFRFHVVANGWRVGAGGNRSSPPARGRRAPRAATPGAVLDTTGHVVADFGVIGRGDADVAIGSIDLDATWVHENGPALFINCPKIAKMCAAAPGVFELSVGGCRDSYNNQSGLKDCRFGAPAPGESTANDNAIFLVRSLQRKTHSVRAAFKKFGVVPYRDYIFASRQQINSLRQTKTPIPPARGAAGTQATGRTEPRGRAGQPAAPRPPGTRSASTAFAGAGAGAGASASYNSFCTFPDAAGGPATTRRGLTCMPGSVNALTKGSTYTPHAAPAGTLYVDAKPVVYDMASSVVDGAHGSSSHLARGAHGSGQVKAAVGLQSSDLATLKADLSLARADGAEIALLHEEDFGGTGAADPGEALGGPHVMGLREAAKALGMYIVAPFRMNLGAGETYNAAVVIGKDGQLLNSTAGVPYYQKTMPVPSNSASGHSGEVATIPGQHGVQVCVCRVQCRGHVAALRRTALARARARARAWRACAWRARRCSACRSTVGRLQGYGEGHARRRFRLLVPPIRHPI